MSCSHGNGKVGFFVFVVGIVAVVVLFCFSLCLLDK